MSPSEIEGMNEREIDQLLMELLGEELLSLMLRPPPVPSFAAETVRPGASS